MVILEHVKLTSKHFSSLAGLREDTHNNTIAGVVQAKNKIIAIGIQAGFGKNSCELLELHDH